MPIKIQRIYDDRKDDGYRVLVDRLWPRGISKEKANLDDWWKELAPSNDLRKWFNHDEKHWAEFRKKYLAELKENKAKIKELLRGAGKDIVLLYGAKDEKYNQAVVLKEYLERLG